MGINQVQFIRWSVANPVEIIPPRNQKNILLIESVERNMSGLFNLSSVKARLDRVEAIDPEINTRQKIAHFFEQYFSKLKSVLEPRQFLYVSSVLVGLSAALAVIVLKTFAHNVFLFSQYLNREFHLPYSNSTLPIIGILLTVFVIKNSVDCLCFSHSEHNNSKFVFFL